MALSALGRRSRLVGRSDRDSAEVQGTSQGTEGMMAPLNDQCAHAVSTAGVELHQTDDSVPPSYGLWSTTDSHQKERSDGECQISREPGFCWGDEPGADGTAGVIL
ncbi:MAG: hypothetical protein CMN93_04885 [Synechococcus sp. CPC35]|nr:hypothetical protein [Synechococcus sp. CPC35]